MADQTKSAPAQAQPATQQQVIDPQRGAATANAQWQRLRRDEFARAFGAAILTAKPNSTPHSLAKQVTQFTDAFLAELDK